ncbi:hypothetical protein [Kineococcus indalonis]|uniref:hypothetical protein n=1 Tax=Kineococcus indalonis TaxID=2696566 RepID=UPI001412C693|nr:hypothetical protein [Kineococcus indalonis]NAZ84587.1 hypothetical protein [Kineococcus indalonis]
MPIAHLIVTLHEDILVLTTSSGREFTRLPVDDGMNTAEALELLEAGAAPLRLLWSHEELDDALERGGFTRVSPWRFGPTADVIAG